MSRLRAGVLRDSVMHCPRLVKILIRIAISTCYHLLLVSQRQCREARHPYLIHDRDTKCCESFRTIIDSGDVKTLPLPARSPNLNAYAELWVKSIKDDCVSKLILFGEVSPRRALGEYLTHYHAERNHQGIGNVLLFPTATQAKNRVDGSVACKERSGGLLKYYHREAA